MDPIVTPAVTVLAADGYTPAQFTSDITAQVPVIAAWIGAGVGGGLVVAFLGLGIGIGVAWLFKMAKRAKSA